MRYPDEEAKPGSHRRRAIAAGATGSAEVVRRRHDRGRRSHRRTGRTRAVAYKLQEEALGGLSAPTRRRLFGPEPGPARRRRGLKPGTVLVREWHGVAHQVRIIEGGVLYQGEHYRSLSELARLITGTRWSGPRFFGLKG